MINNKAGKFILFEAYNQLNTNVSGLLFSTCVNSLQGYCQARKCWLLQQYFCWSGCWLLFYMVMPQA